jgi:hypothetical protein
MFPRHGARHGRAGAVRHSASHHQFVAFLEFGNEWFDLKSDFYRTDDFPECQSSQVCFAQGGHSRPEADGEPAGGIEHSIY